MKAIILSVGDELLGGKVVDTNSAYLAAQLGERGVPVVTHQTVGDDLDQIAEALRQAAARVDLVLVTGGLGPTPDDLTRQALGRAMGCELVIDEDCLAEIEGYFSRQGRTMVPANRIQAMIPAGARPIRNSRGTAPGIAATLGRARIFLMPGVPHEMRHMFATEIASRLPAGTRVIAHKVVHTFGAGESDIAAKIADLMDRDRQPAVGTTVAAGIVSIRISAHGADSQSARRQAAETADEIRRRLGQLVIGDGEQTMASVIGELLAGRKATLATAESCTGGLIGTIITEAPGSSGYFLGSIVAYANDVKERLLGIEADVLAAHGAVSGQVAELMAERCRRRLGSDYALSATGIAGPGGGSDDKPVGLVYVALAGPDRTSVHRHVFAPTREMVRLRTALTALNYLRLELTGGSV